MRKSALGRGPARVAVAALVASVVAPLAASGTAAASTSTARQHLMNSKRVAARNLKGHATDGSINPAIKVAGNGNLEKLDRSAFPARGPVTVMLQLSAAPASDAYANGLRRGRLAAVAAGRAQTATIKRVGDEVAAHLGASATKAKVVYRTHALYSGMVVTTDASRLAALSQLPGVAAIRKLTPKSISNSTTVPLIGAPGAWTGRSDTGSGQKIGIIDTGIDYTHANFGGPGTTDAYTTALADDKLDPNYPDSSKVAGGYDFAGDDYDASDQAHSTPAPDNNPLDCEGHGSHVAGTAAGYGVDTGGFTYFGPYTGSLSPSDFKIGPGVAPGATLYALKVFGCSGSTNLVAEALDWAADPNGDGNLSDHLDVVNMSLGSDYGSPQDPDSVASDNASKVGIVVVAAAGNGGDLNDVGGSPGNAKNVIGVAASDDPVDIVDGLKIDSPSGTEPASPVDGTQDNVFPAEQSVAYDWANLPGVTNTEVVKLGDWSQPASASNNIDGCTALSTADAAKVAGKIVLLYWTDTDANRKCGSAGRSAKVVAAGAVGAILGDDRNRFAAGITGSDTIPVMITIKQATDAINAKLDASTQVFATLTNALHNTEKITTPTAVDNVASFSSRGIGMPGNVKPDVAAPGVSVFSTGMGTGSEGISESGTSMATPHVAGVAALVRAAHPGWTVEQVKAAIMDTATQDVFDGPSHTGNVYAPERVGAGRVKADAAVGTQTLAYNLSDPGAVSVSFGNLAVTAPTTLTKTIRVVSTRPVSSAAYTLSYDAVTSIPGVTYTVSPSQIWLAPNSPVDVKVTLTINPAQLVRTTDPTYNLTAPFGLENNHYADASGRVVLQPYGATSGGALRVPVYSAPRRASVMGSASSAVVSAAGTVRTGALALTGTGVNQGTGDQQVVSTVAALQLQGSSPRKPDCSTTLITGCTPYPDDRGGDLKYVGSASDGPVYSSFGYNPFLADPAGDGSIPAALGYVGVSTWGPWRTAASQTEYDVFVDASGDGLPDAVVFNTRLSGSDLFVAETVDYATGALLDVELLNGSDGQSDVTNGILETAPYNSDVMELPFAISALNGYGLSGGTGHTRIKYWVQSFTENGLADTIGSQLAPLSTDLKSPGLGATGDYGFPLLNEDLPGTAHNLALREDTSTYAADKPLGLLLFHHLNGDGSRAQVVTVRRATTTKMVSSKPTAAYGTQPTVTVTVTPSLATGYVQVKEGRTVWLTGKLVGGKVSLKLPKLAKGKHTLVAVYLGDTQYAPSTSPAIVQTIT